MASRAILSTIHLVAGVIGLLTITAFWSTSIAVEIFGDEAAIAAVKHFILSGMVVLIPSMAAVGGSGLRLGGSSRAPIIVAKRRRMIAVAANGLLVLVPSAVFLAGRAGSGDFGVAFVAVQAIELAAGAANIILMGLNMRDGFRLTAKRRSRSSMARTA